MNDPHQLSRRERQIMDLLIACGSATAAEIRSQLPDPPSDSATRTFLRILEDKGWISHQQEGRRYVYQPTQSPERARHFALHEVVQKFFDGSLSRAVAALVDSNEAKLSRDELKRVEAIIAKARKKQS